MRKNVASQVVAFQMNSATDGSAVTTGTPTVYYTIDGGTQGTGTGTATHEGNGQWSYVPTQAETNGNHVAYTMAITGAISQTVNVWPVSFDPTDSVRAGLTALPNAAANAAGGLLISTAGALDMDSLDSNVSAILTDTGTTIPGVLGTPAGADLATDIASIQTDTTAILTDTGTTIPALIGTPAGADVSTDIAAIKSDSGAILTDTGTTIPAQITALNNISVAEILTTQMTESYAADGTAPTLAQALFLIQQYLTEKAISGTTVTIKKLDGTTTAATLTLDDGTSPTSATRST